MALDPDWARDMVQVYTRLTIELLEPVLYYNAASATITPAGLKVLKRIAGVLKGGDDREIRIEAYTDVAIHTSHFPSNMDLTIARANGVLRFLKTQNVAPQTRLSAVGYGDSQPASADDARQAKNRNRRVEIVVTPPQRSSVSGSR
jgi:chemotaxis protein MotB